MKVLITGGMGVIGSMVSSLFVQEGHRPVIMARHLDRSLIRLIEDKIDIELGDILDYPRLLTLIQHHGITHIIHLGGLIGDLSHQNPPRAVNINVMGTLNILEAARFMKVKRVVYSSSKGVYGAPVRGECGPPTLRPLPEDYPKEPFRIYDMTKLMGEHMGQFYHRTYGLEFAALRFASTYGPGKTVRHGSKSYASQIIEGAYGGRAVRFEKRGNERNDFIYNRDVARGVYLACTVPQLRYQAYNIGTGVGATLEEMAQEVKRSLPGSVIEFGNAEGGLINSSILDIGRAREDLGYSPRYSLRSGVQDYLETLKKLGF